MTRGSIGLGVCAALAVALHLVPADAPEPLAGARARVGDPALLKARWARWEEAYEAAGGDRARVLTLRWSPTLSGTRVRGVAQAKLDLVEGRVTAGVSGVEAGALWLVDHAPDRSVSLSPADRFLKLGELREGELLDAPVSFGDLDPDLLVVTRPGDTPLDGVLLAGHTTLFHRLHDEARKAPPAPPPRRRIIRLAMAQDAPDLDALVAAGEALFAGETFAGNGRTCETCHPARNNFTLDPAFVASLPASDPLFVSARDPALADLDDVVLLRNGALVRVNQNGFLADPVMRGVSHTLALSASMEPPAFLFDGTTVPPLERLGWGGDGSPLDGSLREFAIGAIAQHAPRTLARIDGSDFRLPNEFELDALEAFQLSLGRLDDPDLDTLRPRDANAAIGLTLYRGAGRCQACHENGGADVPAGGNASFDTNVADLATTLPLPDDDGWGATGRFNTPPVVEAADTGPWFHNNSVGALNALVGFYSGRDFNASPGAAFVGGIALNATRRGQIVTFLRVLNALENVRSADAYSARAATDDLAGSRGTLQLAIAEVDDAVAVLRDGNLHADAVINLQSARRQLVAASTARNVPTRDASIARAETLLAAARGRIVRE
jgi:mono/diheme cytochrome c family protein